MQFPLAPVLLTVWNRPDETQAALKAIQAVAPVRLFVGGDGPRGPEDASDVRRTRQIIEQARSWNPELTTNYSDANLGCRRSMERNITWFFENVDAGIILEDDCIPHPEFFHFASEMLARYQSDERVLHISGDCSMPLSPSAGHSYTFIRYPHSWGWATWRRAWERYDSELESWAAVLAADEVAKVFPDPDERAVWEPIFTRLLLENQPDSWAWRWAATCIVQGGLSVQPFTNLVSNVGFNIRATHTTKPTSRTAVPSKGIYPLGHPVVARDLDVERQVFRLSQQVMGGSPSKGLSIATRLRARLGFGRREAP